jgi:hypothetical protein
MSIVIFFFHPNPASQVLIPIQPASKAHNISTTTTTTTTPVVLTTTTNYYQLLPTTTNYYQLLPTTTNYYQLLPTTTTTSTPTPTTPQATMSSTNMLSSSAFSSTTLLTPWDQTEERLSQTSTAVATPCHQSRRQSLRATIVDTDADLPNFEWQLYETRDSLEIARRHFAGIYQYLPVQRSREKREAFPFGRDSLDLVRRDVARRAQQQQQHDQQQQQQHDQQQRQQLRQLQQQLGVTPAQVFLRSLGSRFAEDRAAMMTDPILDHALNHRDSLELPREKRARAGVAARRIAEMKKPGKRFVAKAKACKAALSGLVGKCFTGGDGSSDEDWEEKEGLLLD